MTNLSSARCKLLLDWYRRHARVLPWRETNDPYAVWVSEIMLQQTQVKTVLPRYQAWFNTFPDIATRFLNRDAMISMAHFGKGLYEQEGQIEPNTQFDHNILKYYRKGSWDLY